MSDRVPPVPPVAPAQPVGPGRALVVVERRRRQADSAPHDDRPSTAATPKAARVSAVGAQLLGEKPRRGLRAGPEVLEQARSTYLSNEFSGSRDRRPRKGLITKTEI